MSLAQEWFILYDIDNNKSLDTKEIKNLFAQLQIKIDSAHLNKIFNKYDKNKNHQLDIEEFKSLIRDIMRKDDLFPLFKKYTKRVKDLEIYNSDDMDEVNLMTANELKLFFEKEQKEILSKADLKGLININSRYNQRYSSKKYSQNYEKKEDNIVSFRTFSNILNSSNNIATFQKSELFQQVSLNTKKNN